MRIGFIGLGIMGKPMARNLLKAGHELVVYDVLKANVDLLAAGGALAGASSRDVAERCDLIITMVPDGPQVIEVVLGENGVLEGARPGATVIDMSSIDPQVSQRVCTACREKGVHMIDAPVSARCRSWSAAIKPLLTRSSLCLACWARALCCAAPSAPGRRSRPATRSRWP